MIQKTGRAYAECNAPKQEFERELPYIRNAVQAPSDLELVTTETPRGIAISARAGRTNRQTADELASVLNQAYQSPLYQDRKEFKGGIFYKMNNKYFCRN